MWFFDMKMKMKKTDKISYQNNLIDFIISKLIFAWFLPSISPKLTRIFFSFLFIFLYHSLSFKLQSSFHYHDFIYNFFLVFFSLSYHKFYPLSIIIAIKILFYLIWLRINPLVSLHYKALWSAFICDV